MIKYVAIIFLFLLPLYLVKKKFIKIDNILIWLTLLFILSIFSLNIEFIEKLANSIGIISPVNFLIFSTFLIFLFIILNLLQKVNELNNKLEDIVIKKKLKNKKNNSIKNKKHF
tara:strand:- start:2280 stop:2621 length:342 start_codon:yes stop_codon:yes gene_type:complete